MSRLYTELPAYVTADIYQGSPWPGVSVQFMVGEGENAEPEALTSVTADVATDTVARGGTWLASCDISEPDENEKVQVTLDAAATAALPARTVLIDVMAQRASQDEPSLVMRVTATVRGGLPPEPTP